MPIQDFYRGNTRKFRFEFVTPNPVYTAEPPNIAVTAAGTGDYDHITYPLDISSTGVITDTWTLTFTSATEYDISGATTGYVGQGNTSVDTHPNNPDTNTPYFTLLSSGWVNNTIFAAADTLVFSTVARYIAEDITGLGITITFIIEGADTPTIQISSTAGDDAADLPLQGIMYVTLNSGDSADLIAEEYVYGIERRLPDPGLNVDLDDVRTIEVGTVSILTPAKVIAP